MTLTALIALVLLCVVLGCVVGMDMHQALTHAGAQTLSRHGARTALRAALVMAIEAAAQGPLPAPALPAAPLPKATSDARWPGAFPTTELLT